MICRKGSFYSSVCVLGCDLYELQAAKVQFQIYNQPETLNFEDHMLLAVVQRIILLVFNSFKKAISFSQSNSITLLYFFLQFLSCLLQMYPQYFKSIL